MLFNLVASALVANVPVVNGFNANKISQNISDFYTMSNAPTVLINQIVKPENTSTYSFFYDSSSLLCINYVMGDKVEQYLILNKLEYNSEIFIFKEDYSLRVYKDVKGFYTEDENLELYCYAETLKELKGEISENLAIAWKLYVDCDENELSQDAKDFRKMLIQKVKKG